jgi:hypothetical protein
VSRIICEGLVTGLIGGRLAVDAELRDAQRMSHDPRGSQELAPPYFFSLRVEWDDLRDTISDTSSPPFVPITNHFSLTTALLTVSAAESDALSGSAWSSAWVLAVE